MEIVRSKLHFIKFLLVFFLGFNSCNENQEELSVNRIQEIQADDSVIAYIKGLGFQDSDIQDLGEDYLVDGDILFSKTVPIKSTGSHAKEGRVNQMGTGSYVGANISIVKIYVDPSMTSHASEINAAIAQWNSTSFCRLKFALEPNNNLANSHVTIKSLFLGFVCASAYFPVNGLPGSQIKVNTRIFTEQSTAMIIATITHELGHTVGIWHTNMDAGTTFVDDAGSSATSTHIPGTPIRDNASLMNGGTCGEGVTTLSASDKQAFYNLYPSPLSIFGQRLICNSNVYTISNLPSNATVTWSIPSSAGPVLQLSPNQPSTNKLTITSQPWYQVSTTLTALVTVGSNPPVTCTLPIANGAPIMNRAYTQGACTYYDPNYGYNISRPAQSGTVSHNVSVTVHAGCGVTIQLPSGHQASLGTGGTPMWWTQQGSVLLFALPSHSQGVSFVFNIAPMPNDGICPSKLVFKTY